MPSLTQANRDALAGRTILPRDFIRFTVRDRETGAPFSEAYWSDIGVVSAQVINPDTGGVSTYDFYGAGTLIEVSAIERTEGLEVKTVEINLSQVHPQINDLIRGYDPKQGAVVIWRGMLDLGSRLLVSPAFPRFVGYIDDVEITTPAAGQAGSMRVQAASFLQEMTRSNPATRSDADQRLRNANDGFFRHAPSVGTWTLYWGQEEGKADVRGR